MHLLSNDLYSLSARVISSLWQLLWQTESEKQTRESLKQTISGHFLKYTNSVNDLAQAHMLFDRQRTRPNSWGWGQTATSLGTGTVGTDTNQSQSGLAEFLKHYSSATFGSGRCFYVPGGAIRAENVGLPVKEVPSGGVYGAVYTANGLLKRSGDKRIALPAHLRHWRDKEKFRAINTVLWTPTKQFGHIFGKYSHYMLLQLLL